MKVRVRLDVVMAEQKMRGRVLAAEIGISITPRGGGTGTNGQSLNKGVMRMVGTAEDLELLEHLASKRALGKHAAHRVSDLLQSKGLGNNVLEQGIQIMGALPFGRIAGHEKDR